jgi:DNA uptake protein ComE-like DNA-binding protein
MIRFPSTATLLLFLCGCSPNNTQSLQQHTADATAAAKRDAEAITKGVAEGLARKGPVNINTASDKELARLPGVTPAVAAAIVAKRPYSSTRDLVRKRVMSSAEYDRVKAQIVAQ